MYAKLGSGRTELVLTKGDLTRRQILDAIADLVEDHSYDDVSIAEITRRAGVTRPGFYFHFPSKGAAVASLMEALFEDFVAIGSVWYDHQRVDQRDAFREGMTETVTLWRAHARVMHAMVQAAAQDTHADTVWKTWIAAYQERAVPTLDQDLGSQLDSLPFTVRQLADVLVGMVFDAMKEDVRSIVETGEPTPHLVETLWFVWTRTVYPQAAANVKEAPPALR